jgi:hypothetical protein
MTGTIRTLLAIAVWLTAIEASGQINSPFSRFGQGNQSPFSFAALRAMGMPTSAFRSHQYINHSNPASYAAFYQEEYTPYLKVVRKDSMGTNPNTGAAMRVFYNDSVWVDTLTYIYKTTAFETGVDFMRVTPFNNTATGPSGDASLAYIAMAFPIPKFGGISTGLMPYSFVGYDLSTDIPFDTATTLRNRFLGHGGIFQWYFGGAGQWKNLSFGFNGRLLFGTMHYSSLSYFPELANSFGSRFAERISVSGLLWELGLQYDLPLKDNLGVTFGAYANIPKSVNVKSDSIWERVLFTGTGLFGAIESDTISLDNEGKLAFPLMVGGGVMIADKNKWMAAVDVRLEQWEGVENAFHRNMPNNALRLSAGGEIIPKHDGKFFERNRYRLGMYFRETGMVVNNNAVTDFGITFGLGMPIVRPRQKLHSSIDLSFQTGRMGNISDHRFAENYFRFTLGFNLTDNSWIFKSKYY